MINPVAKKAKNHIIFNDRKTWSEDESKQAQMTKSFNIVNKYINTYVSTSIAISIYIYTISLYYLSIKILMYYSMSSECS